MPAPTLALDSDECQKREGAAAPDPRPGEDRPMDSPPPEVLDGPLGAELIERARGLEALAARSILQREYPDVDPLVLRAACAQAQLSERAEVRFGTLAREFLWTPSGLEQASRPAAALYRAQTLADAGITQVVDLTCGIGVDAVVMARSGIQVLAVDSDPGTAAIAERNSARLGVAELVTVVSDRCESVTDGLGAGTGAWFIDPARREPDRRRADGSHRRLDDPEKWSPPWSWVLSLAGRPDVMVAKTAPAIAHSLVATAAAEWISTGGELLEATAWWGIGSPGSRTAVIVDPEGAQLLRVVGGIVGAEDIPTVSLEPGMVLLDPDPAVVRAGAVRDLATALGLSLVDPHLAYAVGDTSAQGRVQGVAGRWWRLLHVGPYRTKELRAACAQAGIVRVDVTGRGRRLSADRVRRDLQLPGGPGLAGVLITMAVGPSRRTVVALGLPIS